MSGVHDPMAARFQSRHPYPEMEQENLGHLWTGPRRNDFDPWLVRAVCIHLEKHKLPHGVGDAKNYIRNRILARDWAALEQREDEGIALKPGETQPLASSQEGEQTPPKAGLELTEAERQERVRVIQEAKKKLGMGNGI